MMKGAPLDGCKSQYFSFVCVLSGLLWYGDLEIFADLLSNKIKNFAMPGYCRRLACISIDIHRVIATFPQ